MSSLESYAFPLMKNLTSSQWPPHSNSQYSILYECWMYIHTLRAFILSCDSLSLSVSKWRIRSFNSFILSIQTLKSLVIYSVESARTFRLAEPNWNCQTKKNSTGIEYNAREYTQSKIVFSPLTIGTYSKMKESAPIKLVLLLLEQNLCRSCL